MDVTIEVVRLPCFWKLFRSTVAKIAIVIDEQLDRSDVSNNFPPSRISAFTGIVQLTFQIWVVLFLGIKTG